MGGGDIFVNQIHNDIGSQVLSMKLLFSLLPPRISETDINQLYELLPIEYLVKGPVGTSARDQ